MGGRIGGVSLRGRRELESVTSGEASGESRTAENTGAAIAACPAAHISWQSIVQCCFEGHGQSAGSTPASAVAAASGQHGPCIVCDRPAPNAATDPCRIKATA